MPRDGRAHSKVVEEHGPEGGKQGGSKIKMKERLRSNLLMLAKKFKKGITTEMMDYAGGQKDASRVLLGKSIAMNELAGQALGGGEAASFGDKSRIEIHTDQLDVVLRERNVRGEPSCGIACAAADVGDAETLANARLPNGIDYAAKKFPDAASVVKLFGKALHFAMDGQEQLVNRAIVKNPIVLGQRSDHAKRLTIVKL